MVARTSSKLGSAEIVVLTLSPPLSRLVIVSPAVNDPTGMFNVTVAAVGFVKTTAVAPLEDPVMVLPTTKFAEDPTVAVIVPTGY